MVGRSEEFNSYRGQHQPPADSPGMHDVSQTYPGFYEHPEYYHTREPWDRESTRVINRVRGNPEAPVTVYRATPGDTINPGDWVTQTRSYAVQHARHPTDPAQDLPVIKKVVKAKDLTTESNSIHEWGWFPQ